MGIGTGNNKPNIKPRKSGRDNRTLLNSKNGKKATHKADGTNVGVVKVAGIGEHVDERKVMNILKAEDPRKMQ